ncbi:hypothetical protein B4098_0380 [Heyndrickxia coagulans]|uniref:Uncharacterized protein n=1 Tax=Heyndrickxia coagulans TaxID=1398 RepID=A0A150K075_HEYCO|nr:hypothetical protein B4098_0380 [Heyndrickxia coagulans]KYC73304.1 hypothetical protein B4099_0573 [Heyndrickxia coagulans]
MNKIKKPHSLLSGSAVFLCLFRAIRAISQSTGNGHFSGKPL